MRSLCSWSKAEHLGSTSELKTHHIDVASGELGNLGALAQHISLYSQRGLSEQRVCHQLVCLNGVSTGSCADICAIGFPVQSYQGSNSHPGQDSSCWGLTYTPDLFLEGPVCFQDSFASNAYQGKGCQGRNSLSFCWAFSLSREELGHGEF